MVRKSLLLTVALACFSWADTGWKDTIQFTETDGSPKCMAGQVKVGAGQLTCSGQTATLSIAGGSGGSSSLQVTRSGVQITSPTASINFYSGDFNLNAISGTTAQISLNPATTNFYSVLNPVPIVSSGVAFGSSTNTIASSTSTFVWDRASFALHIGTNPFSGSQTLTTGKGLRLWADATNTTPLILANPENTAYYPLTSYIGSGIGLGFPNTVAFQITHNANTGIVKFSAIDNNGQGSPYQFFGPITDMYASLTSSSQTFKGPVQVKDLTASRCVQTDSNGVLTSASTLCGSGGGASTLAVATGTINGFGIPTSSPTVALVFDNQTSSGTLVGGSTFFWTLLPSSVTLQGNSISIAGLAASTGTLYGLANGKTNLSSFTATSPIVYNSGTGVFTFAPLALSTASFTGTLPALYMVSTAAFTNSTQTWTGANSYASSTTFYGAVLVSTTVLLGGLTGTNGQVFTSAGPGANASWTTLTGASLTSTQTWSGGNSFQSSTTFNGAIAVSTTILLSAAPGVTGQVLTSGGQGGIPSWTTPNGLSYSSFSAVSPITYNSATGAIGATQISLSSGVVGILPATNMNQVSLSSSVIGILPASNMNQVSLSSSVIGTLPAGNMVSTVAFTTSSQTFSGANSFQSSTTLNGVVLISTTVILGGLTGTNGQVFTSAGPGANASWTTLSSASLGSTQTWTGANIYTSSVTYYGAILISTTVLLNGGTGTNGQVFTSGGPGAVASWSTLTGAALASTQTFSGINTFTSSTTFFVAQASTLNITQNGAVVPAAFYNTPLDIAVNVNNIAGTNFINYSTGTAAAGYSQWTSALGGQTSYYVTVGIVSPNYSQAGFSIVAGSAAFMYSSDSNMEIGSAVNGTQGDIVFGTNLPISANRRMTISSTGTITTLGNLNISSAVYLNGNTGTSGQVFTSGGTGTIPSWSVVSSTRSFIFDATALQALETNFAPIESTATLSTIYLVRAFDDTTREYANGFFKIPSNIYASGTITIRLDGRAKTAASANTEWTLEHLPLGDSATMGGSYLTSNSGSQASDTTQGDINQDTWTMSVSSSTWAASNSVFFRLSRNPSAGSDLTGDYYLKGLSIDVPIQ